MRSLAFLISNLAPNREDRREIAKGVNQLGRTRYRVGNGLIMGQVDNGSDVALLGWVCSERWGVPDKLVGPRCRLAGPPGPRAEGEGKQASRADSWVSAHSAGIKRKLFLFFKLFYNLQQI
jgi:hypothetical protein